MMRPMRFTLTCLLFGLLSFSLYAQDKKDTSKVGPFTTFKTTRIINSHSPETNLKRDLDVRITHRFGDIAGNNGGYHQLFGIDQARDIRIAAEFGITDNVDVGFGRSKGAGPVQEVWDGFVKARFLRQTKDFSVPVTLTYMGATTFSSMKATKDCSCATQFQKPAHRSSYANQLIIASRLTDRLSLALMPTHVHRNFVGYDGQNDLFSLGGAATLRVTKMLGIVVEYFGVFPRSRQEVGVRYYDPLAIGFEIDTGGHIFHLNFSNSGGIGATQFIPYTRSQWLSGEFRFGFNISRLFSI